MRRLARLCKGAGRIAKTIETESSATRLAVRSFAFPPPVRTGSGSTGASQPSFTSEGGAPSDRAHCTGSGSLRGIQPPHEKPDDHEKYEDGDARNKYDDGCNDPRYAVDPSLKVRNAVDAVRQGH